MASLTDILTAAQNIVTALNNNTSTFLSVNGATSKSGITAATVVKATPGRICTISVIAAGSATGSIYDATSSTATTNPVYTIPMSAGAYIVNIPTLYGIVVAPGTNQTVTIGFS